MPSTMSAVLAEPPAGPESRRRSATHTGEAPRRVGCSATASSGRTTGPCREDAASPPPMYRPTRAEARRPRAGPSRRGAASGMSTQGGRDCGNPPPASRRTLRTRVRPEALAQLILPTLPTTSAPRSPLRRAPCTGAATSRSCRRPPTTAPLQAKRPQPETGPGDRRSTGSPPGRSGFGARRPALRTDRPCAVQPTIGRAGNVLGGVRGRTATSDSRAAHTADHCPPSGLRRHARFAGVQARRHGTRRRKSAPPPGACSAVSSASCAWAIWRAMARPSPEPGRARAVRAR